MSAAEERLVVALEARIRDFEKNMQKARKSANDNLSAIERRAQNSSGILANSLKTLGSSTGGLGATLSVLRGMPPALSGIAAALGAERILAYAEAWTAAQNALRTAGVSSDKVGATLSMVYEIAQRQGTALSPLVTLYGRVAQAGQDLGASSGDVAQFTEGVATALRVAGTSSEEASGALLQLSQLLGAGTVRAEEFNSVMEGARPILQTVATGLEGAGGSVSRLRTMVLAGSVSSRDFFQAFLRGMDGLQATASTATDTVGQALNRITNALTRFIGQTDQSLGATQRIAQGLNLLAKNFDAVGNSALIVGTALGVGYASNLAKARLEMMANAEAAKTVVSSQQNMQKSAGVAAAAGRAWSILSAGGKTVAGLLGGPVGIAITSVSVALAVMSARTAASEARFDAYAEALKRAQGANQQFAASTGEASKKVAETQKNILNRSLLQQASDLEDVSSQIGVAFRSIETILTQGRDKAGLDKLKGLRDGLGDTADSALQTKEQLYGLANIEPRWQVIADKLAPLLDKLAAVRAATGETKTALETVGVGMNLAEQKQALNTLAGQIETLKGVRSAVDAAFSGSGSQDLKRLNDSLGTTKDDALKTKSELQRLASSNPDFARLAETLTPLLDKLAQARAAAVATADAIGRATSQTGAQMIDAQVGKIPPAADALLDPTLRGAATTGYINEQTKAYRLSAHERKLQADAEAIYNDAQSKGVELTKKQARAIAEFREQAEKGDQAAERFKAFQQGLKGYGLQTNEMELEAKLIGASTFETTRQLEVMRMLNQAKMDQIALSPQMLATIDAEATKRAAATAAIEDAREKQQRFLELQQEIGDLGVSGIQGLIDGTKSFNDVLKDGISLITQMLLKATLLGQGPLAGVFGGSVANSNGVGGLLGMAFGGFKFADGGVMTSSGPRKLPRYAAGGVSRSAAIFGEAGPEAAVPLPDGRRIPVALNFPGASSAGSPRKSTVNANINIDLTGANGDAAIAKAAREAAAAGALLAIKQIPGISARTLNENQKRRM